MTLDPTIYRGWFEALGALRQDFIETVRQTADIVRLISDYVPLKKAGTRYKGLCPFHQEKTPSFSVDPDRQLFYCFGCQTGGDLFKFAMLYDKLEFPEAVEQIANRFGIPLPAPDPKAAKRQDEQARVLDLHRWAAEFFRKQFQEVAGDRARAYMESRGFGEEIVEALGIGYAPAGWDGLISALAAKRASPHEMAKAGLAIPRKSGQGVYDRFRDRVMFPIRDLRGRVVAFGGRTLADDPAKYINSPETPTYTKGSHLYGYDLARESIRREGFAVVVEGYMDAAALKQAGIDNVVASLGTAFTAQQARLLSRSTERVWFSYDGDAAGGDAMRRSLDLLLEHGFEVHIVDLPQGHDPDDVIQEFGADHYRRLLQEAPGYLESLIRREAAARDLTRPDEREAAVNAILPHVARLGGTIERASWASRIADAFGIEEDLVLGELRRALRSAAPRMRERIRRASAVSEVEARLVHLLLSNPEDRERFREAYRPDDFAGLTIRPIVSAIVRLIEADEPVATPRLLEALEEEEERQRLTRIAFRDEPETGPSLDDCLCVLERRRLERQEKEMLRQLDREASGHQTVAPPDDIDRQLLRLQELARQRDGLL